MMNFDALTANNDRRSVEMLERICEADLVGEPPRTMLIVAHPDDEVIGAGTRLAWLRDATYVHVTDGSPNDLRDAQNAGFGSRQDYAAARRQELEQALKMAGVEPHQLISLGVTDREAARDMVPIATNLTRLLREFEPELILTHPYEGGHPDHDTISFCVQAACQMLSREGAPPPVVIEMAFYHQGVSGLITGEFLPGGLECTVALTEAIWEAKRRMFECFKTQKFVSNFAYTHEKYRVALAYDYSLAPHPGKLFYETLGWNITGKQWRELAYNAFEKISLRRHTGIEHQTFSAKV